MPSFFYCAKVLIIVDYIGITSDYGLEKNKQSKIFSTAWEYVTIKRRSDLVVK